jgi:thioredoxin-like negative regulator of GroEL
MRAKLSSAGFTILLAILAFYPTLGRAADNLKLNPHLDFQSDSADGPLITGDNMSDGIAGGIPNYVIIYAEGCYNSKRQAKRTVSLYEHYHGRVNFVVVDLDQRRSEQQETIIKSFYKGYIPTVVILDRDGAALYSQAGEKDERDLSAILDGALR